MNVYKIFYPFQALIILLKEDIDIIVKCIKNHRSEAEDELSRIIYISDKSSRTCFNCDAYDSCKWSIDKKNKGIND